MAGEPRWCPTSRDADTTKTSRQIGRESVTSRVKNLSGRDLNCKNIEQVFLWQFQCGMSVNQSVRLNLAFGLSLEQESSVS